jgi:hypothetical protein
LITFANGFLAAFLSSSGAVCASTAVGVNRRHAVHSRRIRMLDADGTNLLSTSIKQL